MKTSLIASLLLSFTSLALAQSDIIPLAKKRSDNTLIAGFDTGAKTVKISATGTLEWVNGATLTGASYFRSAAGAESALTISTGLTRTGDTITLATSGITAGSYGSSTQVARYTVDVYGRITAVSAQTITPAESLVTFTDITTHNASTSMHGYLPKLDGNSAHYLDGTGVWSTPPSGLTIGSTTISGGTSGRLLMSGSTVGELTLGSNVATWMTTPTKANLNAAVSDDDPAYVGAANTFTAANTFQNDVTVATGKGIYFGTNYFRTDIYNTMAADFNMVVGRSSPSGNSWGMENGGGFYFGQKYLGASGAVTMTVQRPYVLDLAAFSGSQAVGLAIYNVLTSGTSYEAYVIDWLTTSNVCRIGTDVGSGGGTARDVSVIHGGVEKMRVSSGGVAVGSTGTTHSKIKSGVATLVAGTVTVSDSDVLETGTAATSSRILVTRMNDGGTLGTGYSITRVNATSFTITSTSSAETSTLSWVIFNP